MVHNNEKKIILGKITQKNWEAGSFGPIMAQNYTKLNQGSTLKDFFQILQHDRAQ